MTFLEICQKVAREGGLAVRIASVTDQSGMAAKVVDWTQEAWSEIQVWRNWDFMRATATIPVVAGTRTYDIAALTSSRFASWDNTDFVLLRADGSRARVAQTSYARFNEDTRFSDFPLQEPSIAAMAASFQLLLNTIPIANATLTNDYWKTAFTLALDTDTPDMPVDWHVGIAYKALEKYAMHEEAPEAMGKARREWARVRSQMLKRALPPVEIGVQPLAFGRRFR